MAIAGNNSTDQIVKGRELYTGLVDFRVIAINPTMEEAEKVGLTLKKEPQYDSVADEGHNKLRLDFIVESTNTPTKIITKVAVWLEDTDRLNNEQTKREIINTRGNSTWVLVDDVNGDNAPDWYYKEGGVRSSKVGESQLYSFIQAWLNVSPDSDCVLDTDWSKLVKGDLKELRSYLKSFKNNTLKMLLTVQETNGSYYSQIWPGFFGRSSVTDRAIWAKKLANPYPEIKGDYQGSLDIRQYNIDIQSPDEEQGNLSGMPDTSNIGDRF